MGLKKQLSSLFRTSKKQTNVVDKGEAPAAIKQVVVESGSTATNGASVQTTEGYSKEEAAATVKIQTAYRGYKARRDYRALRALIKVQALVRGHLVRKQAQVTLRCMHALVRLQARARARAVRMSSEGQAIQDKLKEARQARGELERSWVSSKAPLDEMAREFNRRHMGFIRRERAKAYALGYAHWRQGVPPKSITYISSDPNEEGWGWSWLERWMAAKPWRDRSFDAENSRKDWLPPMGSLQREKSGRLLSPPKSELTPVAPGKDNKEEQAVRGLTPSATADTPSPNKSPEEQAGNSVTPFKSSTSQNFMKPTKSSAQKARSNSAPKTRPKTPRPSSAKTTSKRLSFPGTAPSQELLL